MNKFLVVLLFILSQFLSFGQNKIFTRQDSLRGSITPERAWWDLTYYHLDIKVDPDTKSIQGKNTIYYRVLKKNNRMQIDLQPPLKIDKVVQNGKILEVTSDGNAHFISLLKRQKKNKSWKKDPNGKHFIASSCQGIGASIWWPNKDHMYDEVDSLLISVNTPKDLINVSNGRLR